MIVSSYMNSITLTPKPDKDTTKRETKGLNLWETQI